MEEQKYISDKEKAQEIANNNCTHICMEDCSAESYFSSENDCLKSALEAMQWKEKEMLDRACEWLENNASKYVYRVLDEYDMQYYGAIDNKKMIEVFKKAMEGDEQ